MSHAYHAADPSGPCKVCAGERFVETSERGTVRIPPGAFDGYSEVFPGKGNVDMTGERLFLLSSEYSNERYSSSSYFEFMHACRSERS